MNLSLEGKNAVICGSTQGIGLAIAEELALLGANCTLVARNEASLKAAVHNLDTALLQQHQYLLVDFNNTNEVKNSIEAHVKKNKVHILINNSGGPPAGPVIDAAEDAFLNAFNQHLICNHILTKAVVPSMKAEGYGRIINIISTSVKIPLKNLGVSNTIRGAVASWAKTMANEQNLNVQFLGRMTNEETLNIIAAANVYCQASKDLIVNVKDGNYVHTEGMGRSLIESICCGTRVVATDCGAISEFINSKNGTLVEGDENEFAQQIEYTLSLPTIEESQKQSYCNEYSFENIFTQYENLWN